MKAIFSKSLRKRLESASANGSVVASDILKASRKHMSELTSSKVNYFDSIRINNGYDGDFKKLGLKISYCNKALDNIHFPDRGNPTAPYLPENRATCNTSTFAAFFVDLEKYEGTSALSYFAGAMCCPSKLEVVLESDFDGIYKAYNVNHYIDYGVGEDNSLAHSCMRYDDKSRIAADFYTHFAGAKVLRAVDEDGLTWGRALLWDDVTFDYCGCEFVGSFLERIYSNYDFVRLMIIEKAKELGVILRKAKNDYSSTMEFTVLTNDLVVNGDPYDAGDYLSDVFACKKVPANKWHKYGAHYCDTLYYVVFNYKGELLLCNNSEDYDIVGVCRSTDGYAERSGYICPVCGKTHCEEGICADCRSRLYAHVFGAGYVYAGAGVRKCHGVNVFKEMMEGRDFSKAYKLSQSTNKLF